MKMIGRSETAIAKLRRPPHRPGSVARWDDADLVRRVANALDVAARALRTVVAAQATDIGGLPETVRVPPREKVVAETAMLLLCAEPIGCLDDGIRRRIDAAIPLLLRYARHDDVLAAICFEPGLARDHAVAHIILTRLGYPDGRVGALLAESLSSGGGSERLPHRRLEQEWLARLLGTGESRRRRETRLLADSMLGQPMDVLGSSRLDVYAFTHAVMYASDLGRRPVSLPRPTAAIGADAVAGLAISLDADDFDLAAEVTMTWPMLGLAWSPAAAFAFHLLAGMEDRLGFLPGSGFDRTTCDALHGAQRSRFALLTSYHSSLVMGMLCAAAVQEQSGPPVTLPFARRGRRAGVAVLRLLDADPRVPYWRKRIDELDPRQQDALVPLILAMLLRRARNSGDLRLVRKALELAVAHDVADGVAPRQAAALLRRVHALAQARGEGKKTDHPVTKAPRRTSNTNATKTTKGFS